MATLNLSKMKYMSETNLKKFANLIISLSSQVTDIENKCIKPYVDGELYTRDSYVSYNGYIYQATATNQDSAFDETHWDKLSDDFNELTVADIEAMLGLSQEQLETMANLIADTEVRLDKTYSSSKIYQDIQQCLNDSKSYTLKEIAKLNGASYKVVASTSEMTSESIIYLLASGNTYDMYIVEENGATTKIGNMDVNLDNYFTKAEIEADFLKKVDADGKYATITTVDGKVDKDKIVTTLDDSVTDGQLSSAKSVWDLCQKIRPTTVPNVENKDVTSSLDTQVAKTNSIVYTVKNGICYVRITGLCPLVVCNKTVILPNGTLPKTSVALCYANVSSWDGTNTSTILLLPTSTGSLELWCNSNALNKIHYGSFSYPVAE